MRSLSGNSREQYCPSQPSPIAVDFVEPQEWSAIDCLRILRHNRATLAWITIAAFLVGVVLCLVQPRYFQAAALLEVQNINENFLNFRDIYQTASASVDSAGIYLQTQIEILQQDSLLALVAKRLSLEQTPEFGRGAFWSGFSQGNRRNGQSSGQNIVEELKGHLQISPVRNTRIIQIVSASKDPRLAAAIANTLAEVFIAERTEERRREAQQTYDSLRVPLETLRRQIARSEAEFAAYGPLLKLEPGRGPDTLTAIPGASKHEMDTNLRFYQGMLQRLNDAGIASVVLQGNIRLVSKARPAESPYRPNVPLNLAVGILGGLLLGAGWVMLREQTHSVLHTSGEAGKYLTVPELGSIPRFTDTALETTATSHFCHPGQSDRNAPPGRQRLTLSESFRTTLASILASSGRDAPPRNLVITSSLAAEGKTTVVSNLGIALTEISGKVLLIDADMRRPRLHQVFQQANSWGLSDVLREQNAIEDLPTETLVRRTAVPHLYLLPSGPCTDNIFGLLYSERLSRLLLRFRQEFDYVLIDAPPCLEFADARVTARYTDGLLLVIRANCTTRQTAQAALQRLLMDGIPVVGAILNHCEPNHNDLYGCCV